MGKGVLYLIASSLWGFGRLSLAVLDAMGFVVGGLGLALDINLIWDLVSPLF